MPDGTSRQGVGEIAAVYAKIGDKIRALRCLQLAKGDRKNWATAIVHLLKRLASASNTDIDTVWRQISAVLSDLCAVNKNLAKENKVLLDLNGGLGKFFATFTTHLLLLKVLNR